jgi:hypothetical protein
MMTIVQSSIREPSSRATLLGPRHLASNLPCQENGNDISPPGMARTERHRLHARSAEVPGLSRRFARRSWHRRSLDVGAVSRDSRYFVASLDPAHVTAARRPAHACGHWQIDSDHGLGKDRR